MARKSDKNNAIKLRKQGKSYSQIKDDLGVSKSTLSLWLRDIPLSKDRMRELRDYNQERIEKTRSTKFHKKYKRLQTVYEKVSKDIRTLSKRELIIAGFFLYWAEGGKTKSYTLTFANTDPGMIRAFIKWVKVLGGPIERMYVRLQLYSDMTESDEIRYWMNEIHLPKSYFRKSYIKKSKLSDLTYISRGYGTCNVIVPGRDFSEYVLQGLKKISSLY